MSINSNLVPFKTLANGDKMPVIGHGTFGSDKYSAKEVATAVLDAIDVGYRHFDCASVYGNEPEIGGAFRKAISVGTKREDLWVTSKVWNNMHGHVADSCESSLNDLGLDYLDLYLVHWPFPNHHGPGVTVNSRDPHAVPFSADAYLDTWRQMEKLVERGLVRHIGTSNMTLSKLEGLLKYAFIRPAANEMEIHPHFQQQELFDYVVRQEIIPIGYCPIGSPSRPARDRTPEDTTDTEDTVILAAAARLGVHPAVICVLWQIQRGSVPIPFSVKRPQYESMLRAVVELKLTNEEMDAISKIDRNSRLIKGQVFLWESAEDWTDLWK
jgi:alcohol dehydrogenase (NADP+)